MERLYENKGSVSVTDKSMVSMKGEGRISMEDIHSRQCACDR